MWIRAAEWKVKQIVERVCMCVRCHFVNQSKLNMTDLFVFCLVLMVFVVVCVLSVTSYVSYSGRPGCLMYRTLKLGKFIKTGMMFQGRIKCQHEDTWPHILLCISVVQENPDFMLDTVFR